MYSDLIISAIAVYVHIYIYNVPCGNIQWNNPDADNDWGNIATSFWQVMNAWTSGYSTLMTSK